MEILDKSILFIHVIAGFLSLVTFMIPMIVKKGSIIHRKVGWIYVYNMWIVVITAALLSVINLIQGRYMQASFLGFLSLLTSGPLWYGIAILKYKKDVPLSYVRKRRIWEAIIFAFGCVNVASAIVMKFEGRAILLLIFGGLGMVSGYNVFPSIGKLQSRANWYMDHLQGMITGGIAAYTAFFAFGGHSFFGGLFTGTYVAIPWSIPSILGIFFINRYKSKYRKKLAKPVSFVCMILCFSFSAYCQPYVDGGNTRHRFAQLTFGYEYVTSIGGNASYRDNNSTLQTFDLASRGSHRFTIGGTHFWGHADFYFTMFSAGSQGGTFSNDDVFSSHSHGFETVFKYYPKRIEHNKLRPFIGAGIVPYNYRQNNKNLEYGRGLNNRNYRFPLIGGMTFNHKKHLINLSVFYNYSNQSDYYVSRNETINVSTPQLYASIGYKFFFDTTILYESQWKSGATQKLTDLLREKKKLDGIFVGVGPSTSFGVGSSSYNQNNRPYLDENFDAGFMLDLSIGYFWSRPELSVNLNWRKFRNAQSSYGTVQSVRRNSRSIEMSKGLADYHGFVPYIGPILSYETLSVRETHEDVEVFDITEKKISAGILFGWDIKPTHNDFWFLRTNLRYFPSLKVNVSGDESISLGGLEFNFIQLIIYPQRLWN